MNNTVASLGRHGLMIYYFAILVSEEHVVFPVRTTWFAIRWPRPHGLCVKGYEKIERSNQVEREYPLFAIVCDRGGARLPIIVVVGYIKIGERIGEIVERHEEFAGVEVLQSNLLRQLIRPRLRILIPVA